MLPAANSEIKFVLKGKMDRVQEEDGMLHVFDYKTGNVEPNKLTFTDNKDIIQNKKSIIYIYNIYTWFQTFNTIFFSNNYFIIAY